MARRRPLRILLAAAFCLGVTAARPGAAQEPIYQEPYSFGASQTLRLKTYQPLKGSAPELEARLEVPVYAAGGKVNWKPVLEQGPSGQTGAEGWTRFRVAPAASNQRPQFLCDLPLDAARRRLLEQGYRGRIRLQVRRTGWTRWFQGSWQGEFLPPEQGGVLAWTYWLPNTPPPWQSSGGFLAILGVLIWIGCIAAVRAEGRDAGIWRHAGWLHLPGALLFFIVHQAPPNAGLGRELKLPPLPTRGTAHPEASRK